MGLHGTIHNQAKWRGCRPAYEGTQVLEKIVAGASTIIYTVPADKVLLLFDWSLGASRDNNEVSQLQVRDDTATERARLVYITGDTGEPGAVLSSALWVPIELIESWDIYVATTGSAYGYIHGILVDFFGDSSLM